MVVYTTTALSKYLNQEGYLDLFLDNLVKTGKAVNGLIHLDKNKPDLIHILYDIIGNPYLVFNSRYKKQVDEELAKRFIKTLDSIASNDLSRVIDDTEIEKIHNEFQIEVMPKLLHSPSTN